MKKFESKTEAVGNPADIKGRPFADMMEDLNKEAFIKDTGAAYGIGDGTADSGYAEVETDQAVGHIAKAMLALGMSLVYEAAVKQGVEYEGRNGPEKLGTAPIDRDIKRMVARVLVADMIMAGELISQDQHFLEEVVQATENNRKASDFYPECPGCGERHPPHEVGEDGRELMELLREKLSGAGFIKDEEAEDMDQGELVEALKESIGGEAAIEKFLEGKPDDFIGSIDAVLGRAIAMANHPASTQRMIDLVDEAKRTGAKTIPIDTGEDVPYEVMTMVLGKMLMAPMLGADSLPANVDGGLFTARNPDNGMPLLMVPPSQASIDKIEAMIAEAEANGTDVVLNGFSFDIDKAKKQALKAKLRLTKLKARADAKALADAEPVVEADDEVRQAMEEKRMARLN